MNPREGKAEKEASPTTKEEDELVIVASHEVAPTVQTKNGLRFDRESVNLPKGHVVLPELVDDMDVSQKLAVSLADGIMAKLAGSDAALRRETSVVLAQRGKTDAVWCNPARARAAVSSNVRGARRRSETVDAAAETVSPSGPYTLQCMMPNVAAGRAALQMNLNGPNLSSTGARNLLKPR